jgi:hypothetical protein
MLYPAAVQSTEHDPGLWVVFSTTDRIGTDGTTSRWRYWFDAQARFFDMGDGASQYVVRPGIGYDISDNMTVWAGYARFYVDTAAGSSATENRYWQQLTWTAARPKDATVSMRIRTEQRSVSTGKDTAFVLRYQVRYVRKLQKHNNLDLILAVEPFIDFRDTDWGGNSGLGQNRTFAGIGWKASDKISLETGYMNQYIWRDSAEELSNHLAVVSIKAKF